MSLVVCPFAAISERVGSSESGGTHIHCNARMSQYGESGGVLIRCNSRMSQYGESGGVLIRCNSRMSQCGESDGVLIHCNARMSERWWVWWCAHSLQCTNE